MRTATRGLCVCVCVLGESLLGKPPSPTETPPERNMGPGIQTGSDIQRPLPPWTEWQTQ